MYTIHKHHLNPGKQALQLHEGYRILSVQSQFGSPCLWVLVDTNNVQVSVDIAIFATGEWIHDDCSRMRHIETFMLEGGGYVFHAFEVIK